MPVLKRRLTRWDSRAPSFLMSDDEITEGVNLSDMSGRDHGRRVHLVDDRRAWDPVAG
jgi:hypothetical protein